MAKVKEDSHRVGAAVLSYPPGRAIVNAAEKHIAMLQEASAALKVCIGYVDALDSPLPADSTFETVDWVAVSAAFKVCDGKLAGENIGKEFRILDQASPASTTSVPCFLIQN